MSVISEKSLQNEVSMRALSMGLQPIVLGSGDPNAQIVIVGEAPGYREVENKIPFSGASGRVLWDALRKHGITRQQVYTTNVIKRQVSGEVEEERQIVGRAEADMWGHLLKWELAQLPNAKYILLLGNYSMVATLGLSGVTAWRGSVITVDGRTHVITFNPAMTMREPKWEVMFRFDIGKLDQCIKGTFREHKVEPTINPSYRTAVEWLDRLSHTTSPIAFDIEFISNETACIGFADNAHTGICINFRTQGEQTYTVGEERDLVRRIQALFDNNALRFVAQNGGFDCSWLWYKDRIKVPAVWFDTMLAHHTLYPQLPHHLGFLTTQYTTHPYYKDEGKYWREGGNIDQFWEYNVKDCCITWAAHNGLLQELRSTKMEKFFFEHVMALQPKLIRSTVCGVKIDLSLREQIREDVTKQVQESLDSLQHAIHSATNGLRGDVGVKSPKHVNPRSTRQVGNLLFADLKLVGRGTKVDESNRKRMLNHTRTTNEAKEVLLGLDRYAEESKFLSVYADMQEDQDGRIRTSYNQSGTTRAPGRLSSSQMLWVVFDSTTGEWRRSGTNLQNQPVRAQPMFIADPGYEFSYFDLSQAEARVVAYRWKVKGLIENFELQAKEGVDVHRANAARIFRVPIDDIPVYDWTPDGKPTRRYLGKRCVHGLNYRMMPDKLAEVCNIAYNQSFEAWRSYHRAFPEIQVGWENTIKQFQRERVLFNALGRRFVMLGRMDDQQTDSIIAFYPQSTIGDKVASVWYKCENDPAWPTDARIILNVHDAEIALHRPQDGEVVRALMKKYAEEPIWVDGQPVVIPAELKQSHPDDDGIHRWSGVPNKRGLLDDKGRVVLVGGLGKLKQAA